MEGLGCVLIYFQEMDFGIEYGMGSSIKVLFIFFVDFRVYQIFFIDEDEEDEELLVVVLFISEFFR